MFAQADFSVNAHLAMNYSFVAPTIGIELNLYKIDLIGNTNFWIYTSDRTENNFRGFNSDFKLSQSRIEICAGFAPKALVIDNKILTFPVLLKMYFRNDKLEYDDVNVFSNDNSKIVKYSGFGLNFGPRFYYKLNQNWSLYSGILFEIFLKSNRKYANWLDSPYNTYIIENNNMLWFDHGKLELGVRYTLG